MTRNKSLKKAENRIEPSQKSKDRKRILEIINGGHLSLEEVSNVVDQLRNDPHSVTLLEGVASGKEYDIAVRIRALAILDKLGVTLGDGLGDGYYRSLKAAFALKEECSGLSRGSGDDLPAGIDARIDDLNGQLQSAVVEELIEEEGEKSLPLLAKFVGKSEKMDLAIAQSLVFLPVLGSVDLLHEMAAKTGDNGVKKAIKRSLYRLKQKGVEVEDSRSEDLRDSIFQPPSRVSEGYLSSIDGLGDRLVWLIRPRSTRGLCFFEILVNDREGIREFQGAEITRKMYREYLTRLKEESPMPIVEAEPSYCQYLIEEGYDLTVQKGYSLPEGYLQWKDEIGQPGDAIQRPLIYSCFGEESVRADGYLLARSGSLFELREFATWTIPPNEIERYNEMVRETNESKLILSPIQKQERIVKIYSDAAEQLFDEERCLLYQKRLEEMAYIIYRQGDEEQARVCFATSLSLKDNNIPLSHNPFLVGLIERSVTSALQEEEERGKENPSFIIKP